MTAQLSLPICCLPGCTAIVTEWGEVCDTCQNDCGDYLVRVERRPDVSPDQIAHEIAQRDHGTMQAYADQAAIASGETAIDTAVQWLAKRQIEKALELSSETTKVLENVVVRKPNQLCWICEERRTCTHVGGRWECDTCQEIV